MVSLKNTPAMKIRVASNTRDELIIEVEHAPHQSYSRAVWPAASRYARTVARTNLWKIRLDDGGYTDETETRCLSRAVYAYSAVSA